MNALVLFITALVATTGAAGIFAHSSHARDNYSVPMTAPAPTNSTNDPDGSGGAEGSPQDDGNVTYEGGDGGSGSSGGGSSDAGDGAQSGSGNSTDGSGADGSGSGGSGSGSGSGGAGSSGDSDGGNATASSTDLYYGGACDTIINEEEEAAGPLSDHWNWRVTNSMHSLQVLVRLGSWNDAIAKDFNVDLRDANGAIVASGHREVVTASQWGTVMAYQITSDQEGWNTGTWSLDLGATLVVGHYDVLITADCPTDFEGYYYY